MDMKRLHSYLSKQIPSTLQRVSTSQIPLLSLVKKHLLLIHQLVDFQKEILFIKKFWLFLLAQDMTKTNGRM